MATKHSAGVESLFTHILALSSLVFKLLTELHVFLYGELLNASSKLALDIIF